MLNVMFLGAGGSVQELQNGNTSLLITGEEGRAAVDLSVNLPVLIQADVDAVILTHEHIDHVYGLPSLLHQLWLTGRRRPLDIHLSQGIKDLAEGMLDLFDIRKKANMFPVRLCTEPSFCVGTIKMTLFPVDHTGNSVGVVAEEGESKLVYTADTRPVKEIPALMKGAHVLIHEASGVLAEEETLVKKGHSSGSDAGRLAAGLGVRRLYLCHLPAGEKAKEAILKEAKKEFAASEIPEILKNIGVSDPF